MKKLGHDSGRGWLELRVKMKRLASCHLREDAQSLEDSNQTIPGGKNWTNLHVHVCYMHTLTQKHTHTHSQWVKQSIPWRKQKIEHLRSRQRHTLFTHSLIPSFFQYLCNSYLILFTEEDIMGTKCPNVFKELELIGGSISICIRSCACVLSRFSHVWCFATPWTPPGSSVQGIVQAGIQGWVARPSSRGSSRRTDWSCLLCLLHSR